MVTPPLPWAAYSNAAQLFQQTYPNIQPKPPLVQLFLSLGAFE